MTTKGLIEKHSATTGVKGWYVPAGGATDAIDGIARLSLYVGDIHIKRVNVTLKTNSASREDDDGRLGFNVPLGQDVIKMIPKGSYLSLRDHQGNALPLSEKGDIESIGQADDDGVELRKSLNKGVVVDKWGNLKIPFSVEPEKRIRYMDAMLRITDLVYKRFGLMVSPAYGTLLGFARGGLLIDHDDDVDVALALPGGSLEEVVDHFYFVVNTLADDGHHVHCVDTGHFHFALKDVNLPMMDIFASWQNPQNEYYLYFGVGGQLDQKIRYREAELEGQTVVVPECYEDLLAFSYGKNWRIPDPSFQWVVPEDVDRTMTELRQIGKGQLQAYRARSD